jgi:hypothetical protein
MAGKIGRWSRPTDFTRSRRNQHSRPEDIMAGLPIAKARPVLLVMGLTVMGVCRQDGAGGELPLQVVARVGHTGLLTSVAMSADAVHPVTGSEDGTAILWEAFSGKQIRTYEGHAAAVLNVAFSGDGKYLVTGSSDHTPILWEVPIGRRLQTFKGHEDLSRQDAEAQRRWWRCSPEVHLIACISPHPHRQSVEVPPVMPPAQL